MDYDFNSQLKIGQDGERELFQYLATEWNITPADISAQRRGIDCHLQNKKTGKIYSVEIKSDSRAAKTGNAFIETVSVDTKHKPGWAFTSQADFIFYYIPPLRIFYVIKPSWIASKVKTWEERYPTRKIKNKGYFTHGILVPLHEFEGKAKVAIAVSF